MKPHAVILIAYSVALLSSCATKLTPEQRSALQTVTVEQTEVPQTAYGDPYGGDIKFSQGAAVVGSSSGTGAIGGVVGSLVGEAVASTQNAMFRKSSQNLFTSIRNNTPQVGPILNSRLKCELKKDPFCASRLHDNSPNRITSKIVSYRLVRNGKDKDGELLLMPEIIADIHLTDKTGKSLIGKQYVGSGFPTPPSRYAASSAKTKEGYEFAAKVAVDAFTADLARMTAE